MPSSIELPHSEGDPARQAHTDLPAGSYEREMGREGFSGPASQLLHRHPPTGWSMIEGPLRPRAYDTAKLKADALSPFDAPRLLYNPHLKLGIWRPEQSMDHLARNADGDVLIFVHAGAGHLYCDFGHFEFRDGDFIMVPRGAMWRIEIIEPAYLLLIEATDHAYSLPEKGVVGHHAIFDPAILAIPKIDADFKAQQDDTPWRVMVKRHDIVSTITYPFNPLDTIGWHGTLTVVKLNWRDVRPIMSHRYHIPPSAHTIFTTPRFVVCCFCPRPLESDPNALQVPFFHNNDDFDEVIFYHRGKFFSRDHIHPGMLTLHPSGITHGPHPKALARAQNPAPEGVMTDEVAVMLDTRDALERTTNATSTEWQAYAQSWTEQHTLVGPD